MVTLKAAGLRRVALRLAVGLALIVGSIAALPSHTALAAGVVGNGTAASCTEAALNSALAGGGSITFNCGTNPVTITVTSTKTIAADTTVDGANLVTVSGGSSVQIFNVNAAVSASFANITLTNGQSSASANGGAVANSGTLTIRNSAISGSTAGVNSQTSNCCRGGGVYNSGSLTVTASTFSNSTAWNGGAIANVGTLGVTNSTFSGNTLFTNTGEYGGAIDNESGGTATVGGSTFSGNTGGYGGALSNVAATSFTVANSAFSGNNAFQGGVMYNSGSGTTATITGDTFTGNTATISGALENGNFATMNVTGSTFSNNTVTQRAGVIDNYDGATLTITNSSFTNNTAGTTPNTASSGGAIDNEAGGSATTLSVTDSTFSGNISYTQGGAILNDGSVAGITNSTFSGNLASSGGGAIANNSNSSSNPATLTLTNPTLAGNDSSTGAGELANLRDPTYGAAVTITLKNSIVARTTNTLSPNCTNMTGGTIVDGGSNIQYGDVSCGLSIPNTDPKLGPLQNNGGPTQTMALGGGSPAIGGGNSAACPALDQRGAARPQGGGCDIGAYQYGATPALTSISPTSANQGSAGVTLTLTGSNFVSGARVLWNGSARPTTDTSATQLSAAIPSSDLALGGTASVTVQNPGPGDGTSGAQTFTVLTFTATSTATPSTTATATSIATATNSAVATASATPIATSTATEPPSPTASATRTPTETSSPTASPTASPTTTISAAVSATPTATASPDTGGVEVIPPLTIAVTPGAPADVSVTLPGELVDLSLPPGEPIAQITLSFPAAPILIALGNPDDLAIGTGVIVNATDASGNAVTQLSAPAAISFTFTPPSGINPFLAQIYTLDASGQAQALPTHVVANGDGTFTATAQTTHFSPFQVFAPKAGTPIPQVYVPMVASGTPGGW